MAAIMGDHHLNIEDIDRHTSITMGDNHRKIQHSLVDARHKDVGYRDIHFLAGMVGTLLVTQEVEDMEAFHLIILATADMAVHHLMVASHLMILGMVHQDHRIPDHMDMEVPLPRVLGGRALRHHPDHHHHRLHHQVMITHCLPHVVRNSI